MRLNISPLVNMDNSFRGVLLRENSIDKVCLVMMVVVRLFEQAKVSEIVLGNGTREHEDPNPARDQSVSNALTR